MRPPFDEQLRNAATDREEAKTKLLEALAETAPIRFLLKHPWIILVLGAAAIAILAGGIVDQLANHNETAQEPNP